MKVVIAHEKQLIRTGLQKVLEDGGAQVVASVDCGDDAVRYSRGHRPQVLVADPSCSEAIELPDETRLVTVASSDEALVAMEAFKEGATGVVMASESAEALVNAVQAASNGRPYVSPRLAVEMAKQEEDDLTEREIDILRLIALGYTNAESAEELYLSIRTVETHRAHISTKIGAQSRRDLVAHARERGLI